MYAVVIIISYIIYMVCCRKNCNFFAATPSCYVTEWYESIEELDVICRCRRAMVPHHVVVRSVSSILGARRYTSFVPIASCEISHTFCIYCDPVVADLVRARSQWSLRKLNTGTVTLDRPARNVSQNSIQLLDPARSVSPSISAPSCWQTRTMDSSCTARKRYPVAQLLDIKFLH
jgi:hypothetical protein